jgi:hypothetical protein
MKMLKKKTYTEVQKYGMLGDIDVFRFGFNVTKV